MTSIEQVATLPSAAFATEYPKVYGMEMIDPSIRSILEPIWTCKDYPQRPVQVHRLQDVYVAGEGLLFDQDLNVIRSFVSQQSEEDIARAKLEVERRVETNRIATVAEDALVLVKPGYFNYGHWLIELLPQVGLLRRAARRRKPLVYIVRVADPLFATYLTSLVAAGVDLKQVRRYDFVPKLFKSLFIVTGHSLHGPFMSPMIFEALDACRKRLRAWAGARRRLYVRRSPEFSRRMANEPEVAEMLRGEGFVTIEPETLSLREQIRAFSNCSLALGIAGAGMTNICWQAPESSCLVLYPKGMADTFFWWICQHRQIRFADVRCSVTEAKDSYASWNSEVIVDPCRLQAVIREMDRR